MSQGARTGCYAQELDPIAAISHDRVMLSHRQLTVRLAEVRDLDILVDFNCRLAQETEAKCLAREVVRAGVSRVLQDTRLGRYFVAEESVPAAVGNSRYAMAPASSLLGQLMVTTEWSDWRDGHFWWLQSVYVLPEQRRRGVLRALVEHVAALARQERSVCGLRLYVERHNHVAQIAYERLGIYPAGYLVYELDCF